MIITVHTVFISIPYFKIREGIMKRLNNVFLFIIFIVFISCMAMSGCNTDNTKWNSDPGGKLSAGNWTLTLSESGITRTVYVHIPTGYNASTSVPLLLDFHGYMDTPSGQYTVDNFIDKSDAKGFIVAFPQGYGSSGFYSWNAGKACCGTAVDKDLNDVQLAKDIVTLVSSRCSINAKRVYVHGHSNGAGMAHRVAREAADVFAAVSATSMPVLVPSKTPSRPISVLQFHGTADTTIDPDGGTIFGEDEAYLSAKDSLTNWATANGCTGASVTTTYGSSTCETYAACSGGVKVTLCMLKGTNHNDVYDNTDVAVTDMAWDFMSEFVAP
jgi:polyhydroxybutyrate depolymerase